MRRILFVLLTGLAITLQAEEITVSWASNGVLQATGLEPGTTCSVEWTPDLLNSFTNISPDFENVLVDSNGMVQVAYPMFFRVSGTPKRMVLIPSGTNNGTDPDFGSYSLTNEASFYMDPTEVTKAQWDTVYNWAVTNGYSFDNAGSGKASDHPVQMVSWYDCVKWCNARSEMIGKTPCYNLSDWSCDVNANGYRLPTSEEWEYAARGGLSGKRFPWGDTITHSQANYMPGYVVGETPYTSPVGSFAANGHGLYDMAGNVWEWCNDVSGSSRIVRSGSWALPEDFARCGSRDVSFPPNFSGNSFGFRCVSR